MIKVMLVDDHELVRTGIGKLLNEAKGLKVVAEAASGEDALMLAKQTRPDVVLMDVSMPGIGGIEATRKLQRAQPRLKIIVLSMHHDDPFPSRMLQVGARGYLTKGCSLDEMVTAITEVVGGGRYIGSDVAKSLALSGMPGRERSPFDSLSHREMQVMLMLMEGHGVARISETLCLSPKTISTYRHRVFDKLGIENDVELAHMAIRHGVLQRNA